jgi:prepilin peptidase CpaA
MPKPFFPDPVTVFAWTFYVVLVGITIIASYTDLRRLSIPKELTLTGLALGILFNTVRGGLLGAEGHRVWLLGENGALLGLLDGFLFALAGFVVGFALFFIMWILGTCGGGDVKLFGALGAWVGGRAVIYILVLTLLLLVLVSVLRLIWSIVSRGFRPTFKDYSVKAAARSGKKAGKQGYADLRHTRRRLTAYSPLVAVSTALLLLWFFRTELHLAPKVQSPDGVQAKAQ